MTHVNLYPVLLGLAAFISTLSGGLVAVRLSYRRLGALTASATGVLIAVPLFDLLPEALKLAGQTGIRPNSVLQVTAIEGLVDAIERKPSSVLMTRFAGREETRERAVVRVTELQGKHRHYRDIGIDPETLGILIEELRRGLRNDRATAGNTLRRVVTRFESDNDGGMLM